MDGVQKDLSGTVTQLLRRVGEGDPEASDQLFSVVYDDLKRIARAKCAEFRRSGSLEATALVGAACERLLGRAPLSAEDRRHFFFLFGRAMHDVLVEEARSATAAKRGGGWKRSNIIHIAIEPGSDALDAAEVQAGIDALRQIDADAAQVVWLRCFAGRSLEETAELMACTLSRVRSHWDYAKAWLRTWISERSREDGRGIAQTDGDSSAV